MVDRAEASMCNEVPQVVGEEGEGVFGWEGRRLWGVEG